MLVSIHAPVKERPSTAGFKNGLAGFNSRSRERATTVAAALAAVPSVSIHAPVKERRQ